MKEFRLKERDYIELTDLLKVMGMLESGGMVKRAISEGRVTVDDRPETRRRRKVRSGSVVGFDGRRVAVR